MKLVTEFWNTHLLKGLKAKEALAAEGKTPEEIQTSLSETFKFEGDKLKYFTNALDVAAQNLEKLHRVVVATVAEGESLPPKSTKVEEHLYIPYFIKAPQPVVTQKAEAGKGGRGKGGPKRNAGGGKQDGTKTKTSPWGFTPEELAKKGKKS